VGNTLRIVVEDESFQAQARKNLMDFVGTHDSQEVFFKKIISLATLIFKVNPYDSLHITIQKSYH
jgi:hypothetical protein